MLKEKYLYFVRYNFQERFIIDFNRTTSYNIMINKKEEANEAGLSQHSSEAGLSYRPFLLRLSDLNLT